MFDIAKTLHFAAMTHAKVELTDVLVGGQLLGRAIDHHLAGFHDVAGMGHRQRQL